MSNEFFKEPNILCHQCDNKDEGDDPFKIYASLKDFKENKTIICERCNWGDTLKLIDSKGEDGNQKVIPIVISNLTKNYSELWHEAPHTYNTKNTFAIIIDTNENCVYEITSVDYMLHKYFTNGVRWPKDGLEIGYIVYNPLLQVQKTTEKDLIKTVNLILNPSNNNNE